MWIELKTDFSRRYLEKKISRQTPIEDETPSMMRNIL
jgi:hypothetical protein